MTVLVDAARPQEAPDWRVVGRASPERLWLRRIGFAAAGLVLTTACAAVICQTCPAEVTIQARIVPDGEPDAGTRLALANAALRIGPPVALLAGPDLLLTVHAPTVEDARRQAQSLVDGVLDTQPVAPALPAPPPIPDDRPAWLSERARLQTAIASLDAQAVTLSQSLTGIARDLSAGARLTTDRKPGRETLQKGEAALAELTLQRIQLQTKYQDDFPAIGALDAQITRLRAFLADESRRVDTVPAPDPVLTTERDRLRIEQSQVDERRRGLLGSLAAVEQHLAEPVPVTLPAAAHPSALLLQGALTALPDPGLRLALLLPLTLAGLALSALAALLPRRRPVTPFAMPLHLRLPRHDQAALPDEHYVPLPLPPRDRAGAGAPAFQRRPFSGAA